MLLKILHFVAWYIVLHLLLFVGIFLVMKLLRHYRRRQLRLPVHPAYSAVS